MNRAGSRRWQGKWAPGGLICALGLVAAGCSAVGGDGGATKTEDSGGIGGGDTLDAGSSSGGSSSGASSGGAVDSGPLGCVPDCEIWQVCDAGLCVNKVCKDDKECNAAGGPPAGVKPHYCYKGKCALFQCGKDEDCPEGQACNDKTYVCYTKKTGCSIDSDCIDSNLCTSDTCDTKTGKCVHKKVNNCCNADLDCDDGSKCTDDSCNKQTSSCEHKAKDKCCTEDVNCADSSACTIDTCDKATGQCKFAKKPSCCEDNGECDDAVPGTQDLCVGGTCVHKVQHGPATCKVGGDCYSSTCATIGCILGHCSASNFKGGPGCCHADKECPYTKKCHEPICGSLQCHAKAIKGAPGPHAWWPFDGKGLDGWTANNENKTASWHQYSEQKVSGTALRYGVSGKKTWAGGFPNKGQITSPNVVVPAGGKLDFWVYFDGEPGAGVHLFGLQVVEAGKGADVWTKNADLKGNTGGAWKQFGVDLGKWSGKTVQLRWWFDVAVSFPKEDGHGLVVDEMVLSGACP